MADFYIVTACSRPQNLGRMAETIRPGAVWCNLNWLVEMDLEGKSMAGNPGKNAALERIPPDSWMYFLDDDNLIHPDFFSGLAEAIKTCPEVGAFVFHQEMSGGRREAAPENMFVGSIDLAQCTLSRKLIGERRFQVGAYESDGLLLTALYAEAPQQFVFIDRVLSYYNRLKW